MEPDNYKCSGQERAVLDMVKCWPGVPAQVTLEADGTWSVATLPQHRPKRERDTAGGRPSPKSEKDC